KEFVKRNGEFTVNIALIENGNPVLGVIYIPVSKELYFTAADGKSSKKITLTSVDTTIENIFKGAKDIHPSKPTSKVKIIGSRSHNNKATKNFITEIEKHN
ncbi:3'(2'),5'-bisphosphate nucleotidase CysQ, partial [Aequorivita sp. F47161]